MNTHISLADILLKKKEVVLHTKKEYEKLTPKQHEALNIYKRDGYIYINKQLRMDDNIIYVFDDVKRIIHTTESQKDNKELENFTKKRGKMRLNNYYKFIHHYGPERVISLIKQIDSVFLKPNWPRLKSFKIDTLYRGTAIAPKQFRLEGSTITFNDYLSATFHSYIPIEFMANSINQSINNLIPVFLIIKKCDNLPVIFLDWKSIQTKNLEKLKYNKFDEFELLLPRGCVFKIVKKYKYDLPIYKEDFEAGRYKKLSQYYSNVQNLSPDFFKDPEIEEFLKEKPINVMELEFIKWNKPQPIELGNIPLKVELNPELLKTEGSVKKIRKNTATKKKKSNISHNK
jgi:hypothetical protein